MRYKQINDSEYLMLKEKVKMLISSRKEPIKFIIFYYEELTAIGIKGRKELPPLGTLYFAAALHEVGVDVKVLPFTEKTEFSYSDSNIDFIGYSITSSLVYPHYKELNERLKQKHPHAITLAGNTHANLFPREVLADLNVDAVLCGEGEYSILVLLKNFLNHSPQLFSDVPGAYTKEPHLENVGAKVKNVSLLPYPYRIALEDEYILLDNRIKVPGSANVQVVTFLTSRGCPYNCYFCANLNNGSVRYRTKEDMELEVVHLKKRYPDIKGLLIMDETATLTLKHVRNWTQVMRDNQLQYVLSTRGDAIETDRISCLAVSGCKEIKFGLETGSPDLLAKMNKHLDLEEFENTLWLTKKFGINNKVFLMHGFPGENLKTTHETIAFLQKNRSLIDRAVLYQFAPLPGSYVYNNPEQFGINHKALMAKDFTIYNNMSHFWGSSEDYTEMILAYNELDEFIAQTFQR